MKLIISMLLLFLASLSVNISAQSRGIDLSSISGSFAFQKICQNKNGDLWTVGSKGYVNLNSRDSSVRRDVPTPIDLNAIFFVTDSIGWAVGDRGAIFNTRNKGSSWSLETSNTKSNLHAIFCRGSKNCWAVGDDQTILSFSAGRWHKTNANANGGKDLSAVHFVTSVTGWVAGEDGLLMKTDDGGETWIEDYVLIKLGASAQPPFDQNLPLLHIFFTDEKNGWTVASSGVARTTDGGNTWSVSYISNANLIGLARPDPQKIVVVSNPGPNWESSDNGLKWVTQQ